METSNKHKRIWTWVSGDGKSMHAGIGTKPGGHDEQQPFNLADGKYVSFTVADSGRIASDAPPKGTYPPAPPAPKEPHLRYSIEGHTLFDPKGGTMANDAYSGKGKDRNKAASQDKDDHGPIPEGNWRIEEIKDLKFFEDHSLQRPVFRLMPDAETEKRVGKDGMNRKPFSLLIHGNNKENDASTGCIILNKPARERLRKHEGEWLRVTK